jgi:tetratricopeptide (TPR) repeat protein
LPKVLAHRAIGHRLLGDYQQSIDDAENALTILEIPHATAHDVIKNTNDAVDESMEYERQRIKALALRSKGLGLSMQGEVVKGLEWQQHSFDLYQQIGDVQNMATVSMELAVAVENMGQLTRARPLYLFALETWRTLHNLLGQATVLNSLGVSDQEQGRHRDAFTYLTQAIDCARRSGYMRM